MEGEFYPCAAAGLYWKGFVSPPKASRTMRKPLIVCTLVLAACAGEPPIREQADAVRLTARVVSVAGLTARDEDGGIAYVPASGAIVPIPSTAPALARLVGYRYGLAVAGRGDIEVESPRHFALGQCVLVHIRAASADKARLTSGDAAVDGLPRCD